MGLILDKFVKNKDKKFWITLGLDIAIVIALVWFGLRMRREWMNGFEYCYRNIDGLYIIKTDPKAFPDFYNFTNGSTDIVDIISWLRHINKTQSE